MSSTVAELTERGLVKPPKFLPNNIMYETIMGSVAYGVSSDTSDMDIYGFCIPHKDVVFPHLAGEILGFGRQKKRFEQWQQHHVKDPDALGGKGREYDFAIYNIVKYFQLCMENNPNMIDSLYTPTECVLHCTKIGNMVRDKRDIFLHKGVFHKMKGYAYSQLHKMKKKPTGKRKELVEKWGYDIKFAYHVVRLANECHQILTEGTLDLRRDREQLKSIRRGEWTEKEIKRYFTDKERILNNLYEESNLQQSPDEEPIKELLLNCLEEHYGSLEKCIILEDPAIRAIKEINEILSKYNMNRS